MKKVVLTMVIFVGLVGALSAQNLTAAYVQGAVTMAQGNAWDDVYIGDVISSNATIRVAKDAYAEISNGTVTVKLTAPGTYNMQDLFDQSKVTAQAGLGNILANRIAGLVKAKDNTALTTIGGVRGAAVESPQTAWAGGGDATTLIQSGLTELSAGKYNAAYYDFSDAYDAAGSDQAPEARFYMGYAAFLQGDYKNALQALTTYAPNPKMAYYSNQVLTLAQLQVETFAYEDALSGLLGFLTQGNLSQADQQTAHLLQGLAYDGLGKKSQAVAALTTARDANPASDVGQAAAKVLSSL